jgi:hypothetical protein
LQGFAVNQNVIQVCSIENIEIWTKNFVNLLLEGCRCICEFEGHDERFKEAILGSYGGFPYVLISYFDEIIGIIDVNFGDVLCFG